MLHWAQSFHIERSRLGASLDDIAQQVARSLNVQMYRSDGARAAVLSPQEVLADDLAIARYPNHAPSYSALAAGLVNLGRFDECVELQQRAIRLSPRDPVLGAWHLH